MIIVVSVGVPLSYALSIARIGDTLRLLEGVYEC
jgi:hypothetical protein